MANLATWATVRFQPKLPLRAMSKAGATQGQGLVSMSLAHYLENMGMFLVRVPTKDHMDIPELFITRTTSHWTQCSGVEHPEEQALMGGREASPKGKNPGEVDLLLVWHEVV